GHHDNKADADWGRDDGGGRDAVFSVDFVRATVDRTIRNAYRVTPGRVHFERLVLVAESQHGLGLVPFRIRHFHAGEGIFLGASKVRSKEDGDKKGNGGISQHHQSISKPCGDSRPGCPVERGSTATLDVSPAACANW